MALSICASRFCVIALWGVSAPALAQQPTTCTPSGSTSVTCTYQPKKFSIEDLWITSFFDYGHNGVIKDDRLKVAGFGDTYCTYLKFAHNPPFCASELPTPPLKCTKLLNPLEGLPQTITNAQLQLYAFNPGSGSSTTKMTLGLPTVDWSETCTTTSQNTCEKATKTGNGFTDFTQFKAPGQVYHPLIPLSAPPYDAWYSIDVTQIYKDWSNSSVLPNHLLNTGIALCPSPFIPSGNIYKFILIIQTLILLEIASFYILN
jgi:hypothetical protein